MAGSRRAAGVWVLTLALLGLGLAPLLVTEVPVQGQPAQTPPSVVGGIWDEAPFLAYQADTSLLNSGNEWLQQSIRDEIYDQVYYHYWDLREHMEDLQVEHSQIMQLSSIGRSVDGERDPLQDYGKLLLARVTNLSDPTPKPEIYIDGGHHGNEQLGMEVAVLLLDYLVQNYGSDPGVRQFVDSHDTYILPMVNVDGNTRDTRANANGVDLNRNYPFEWAGAGSGPASEPEVAANVALFEAHDFQMYISMHTGTRWFLTPWGYTHNATPDVQMYQRLEAELENLTGFPAGPASTELYIAKGTSLDYGYSLGMPSVTVEVDGEQWGLITVEEKQTRLTAAFTGSLYMMENFPLFGAYPVVRGADYPDQINAGEAFTLSFEVENIGFGPLSNGTFWLMGSGFTAAPANRLVAELGPGNTTRVNFSVTADNSGSLELWLEGSYRPRIIDASAEQTLSSQPLAPALAQATDPNPSPPIEVQVGEAEEGLPGWALPVAALVALGAVGLAMVMRGRVV